MQTILETLQSKSMVTEVTPMSFNRFEILQQNELGDYSRFVLTVINGRAVAIETLAYCNEGKPMNKTQLAVSDQDFETFEVDSYAGVDRDWETKRL